MNTTNQNLNGDNHTPEELAAAKLTAFALGQLPAEESAVMERGVVADQREVREIETLSRAIFAARAAEPPTSTSPELKTIIGKQFEDKPTPAAGKTQRWRWPIVEALVAGGIALVLLALLMPASQFARRASPLAAQVQRIDEDTNDPTAGSGITVLKSANPTPQSGEAWDAQPDLQMMVTPRIIVQENEEQRLGVEPPPIAAVPGTEPGYPSMVRVSPSPNFSQVTESNSFNFVDGQGQAQQQGGGRPRAGIGSGGMPGAPMPGRGIPRGAPPGDVYGVMPEEIQFGYIPGSQDNTLIDESLVYRGRSARVVPEEQDQTAPQPRPGMTAKKQLRKDGFSEEESLAQLKQATNEKKIAGLSDKAKQALVEYEQRLSNSFNYERSGEQYAPIHENSFLSPRQQPLSTFSIDVDTASYANVRRFLTSGRVPPPDAVRIEELVNYFRYDYGSLAENRTGEIPTPREQPFSVNMETAECPWREGHLLLRVGLKGKDVERAKRPVSNLVFLLDVSGSMSDANKLPLLKTAMKMLVGELGENDRVSIVTYAGDAGLKLPSARGYEQKRINAAIDSLSAGGSTNGSAGIELAYEQATAHFIEGGTNRVILCTDGDLNVGVTSDQALVELIKRKAASHVFLTVLGFGEGNLQDAKMERLADNGNGLYAYIDSVREARKVLVEQLTGSTITIAKDVKIQIEFNPAQIAAYRLLGYENRLMAAQDFNNDKKDAGEIGAGHTVTALYELVPAGAVAANPELAQPDVDALKYQQPGANLLPENRQADPFGGAPRPSLVPAKDASGELLTLKLRYKQPEGETSQLLEYPLKERGHSFNSASPDFQFAAAVASFGMVLRNSQHRGSSNLAAVAEIATGAIGGDAGGYRAEFVDLVRKAQGLGAR